MSGFALHPEALADPCEIGEFVASNGPEAADRVFRQIHDAIRAPAPFSHLPRALRLTWRAMRFHAGRTLRSLTGTDEEPLLVLAVLHGRRNRRILGSFPARSTVTLGSSTRRRRFDGDIDGAGTKGNQEES